MLCIGKFYLNQSLGKRFLFFNNIKQLWNVITSSNFKNMKVSWNLFCCQGVLKNSFCLDFISSMNVNDKVYKVDLFIRIYHYLSATFTQNSLFKEGFAFTFTISLGAFYCTTILLQNLFTEVLWELSLFFRPLKIIVAIEFQIVFYMVS